MDNYTRLRSQVGKYVKNYPTPTAKENVEMFKKLFLLRDELPETEDEYDSLRHQLIISNGGFAMKYAIAYCKKINDSELIEDLFQQAQIGIVEAVDRFDPYRGVNFTTFAYFYVRKCIIDYIKRNKVISVNRNIARYIKHISEVHDELLRENEGFNPNVDEIQEYLKRERNIEVKSDVVVQLLTLIDLNSTSDNSFTTDNFDNIPFDESSNEHMLIMQLNIFNDLPDLTEFETEIIKLRFGIGCDRPYPLDELKTMGLIDDKSIANIIDVSNLYIKQP